MTTTTSDSPMPGTAPSIGSPMPGASPQPGRARQKITAYPMNLPDGLRAAMSAAGMSAGKLAANSGMARNSIGNYLAKPGTPRNRTPRADHLRRLTAALAPAMGLPIEDLWAEFGRLIDRDVYRAQRGA